MPTTIRNYILNNPGEPPNWSQREYNVLTDIISKLPGANETYTAGRHTHSKLVSPNESHNPAVQVDNDGNVGIGRVPIHTLDIEASSGRTIVELYGRTSSDSCELFLTAGNSANSSLYLGDSDDNSRASIIMNHGSNVLDILIGSESAIRADTSALRINVGFADRDLYVGGDTNNISWWDASEHRMVMLEESYIQFCSSGSGTLTTDGAKIYFDGVSDDSLYIICQEVSAGHILMSAYSGVTIYHATQSPILRLDYQNTDDQCDPYILFQENSGAGADDEWSLGMDTGNSNVFRLTAGGGLISDTDFVWTIAGRYGIGELSPASALDIDDDAGGTDMGYITMEEIYTDAAAPAADHVAIFARVNGGKTELCARFNTGAIQQLAIEP